MASTIPGVHRIDANPVTGSILVHYDRHDPDVEQRLTAILEDLDSFLPLINPDIAEAAKIETSFMGDIKDLLAHTPRSAGVRATVKGLNQRIQDQTIPLDTLLLTLIAGAGYLLLSDRRSPVLLGGVVAMSLHSFVDRRRTSSPQPSGKISDAKPTLL
jgi:hypothetical protein